MVVSTANIGNTENFVEELSDRYKTFLDVSDDHGAVSAVGEGIGCDPKVGLAIYDRMRRSGVPFAGSYLTPHSVTYLVPKDQVKDSVGLLHGSLVEEKVLC